MARYPQNDLWQPPCACGRVQAAHPPLDAGGPSDNFASATAGLVDQLSAAIRTSEARGTAHAVCLPLSLGTNG
jgi:hypothetical protein